MSELADGPTVTPPDFDLPSTTEAEPPAARRRFPVGRVALGAALLLLNLTAAIIAFEQHRQSTQLKHQTCYARASAFAQLASVEIAKGSPNPPDPGLVILYCDQQSGNAK